MGMNDTGPLPETSDLVVGALPVDLSSAALNGKWYNLKNCEAVNALLISAIGTAGDDPVITLEQATDASGTGAKTLNIQRLDYKIGSTDIEAADDFWVRDTAIDRDNPAASWDSDGIAGAENGLLVNIYILGTDLDVNNNFTHARLKVADVGVNAQLGTILYIPASRHYRGAQNSSFLE